MFQIGNIYLGIDNILLIAGVAGFAVLCSIHAIIYKRESYAAFAWLGVILLSPLVFSGMFILWDWKGVLLIAPLLASTTYLFLGVNRLSRQFKQAAFRKQDYKFNHQMSQVVEPLLQTNKKWRAIASTGDNLDYSPIHYCDIGILNTGDEAYPAMLDAIANAKKSISLYSYIFTFDAVGQQFAHALVDAVNRGVYVKVLVDAVGSHSTIHELQRTLTLGGVRFGRFMPVLLKTQFSNLRNHRKLLVIDAHEAFTGGLNIAANYWPSLGLTQPVTDLHFKLQGRLVNYLQEVFSNDWAFATGEQLSGSRWFDEGLPEQGQYLGRLIVDGPGRDDERLSWHFLNAINAAELSIKIVTPYFLPNSAINSALCSAAIRGVKVEIIVPNKSDHWFMDWALRGSIYDLIDRGCLVYLATGDFDHSKLFVVDDDYASIGSANWDARSLRLNYELNLEVYGRDFVASLSVLYEAKKKNSLLFTKEDWINRSLYKKLRDGIARLFSPYL